MKTKTLDVFNGQVNACVNNEYPTSNDAFRQPCLQLVVGMRTSGKSFLTSRMLAQFKKDKTFDVVYLISPSFKVAREGSFYLTSPHLPYCTIWSARPSVWRCQRGRFGLEDHSLTLAWGAHQSRFSAFTVPYFTVNVDLSDASSRRRYDSIRQAVGCG